MNDWNFTLSSLSKSSLKRSEYGSESKERRGYGSESRARKIKEVRNTIEKGVEKDK